MGSNDSPFMPGGMKSVFRIGYSAFDNLIDKSENSLNK
jgi:hypothetical protein